jgi:hypothetical protein
LVDEVKPPDGELDRDPGAGTLAREDPHIETSDLSIQARSGQTKESPALRALFGRLQVTGATNRRAPRPL